MKSTFSLFFLIVIGSKLFSIETNKSIDSINDLSMSFAETDATKLAATSSTPKRS